MANTNILIKRSGTTRTPVSLGAGEFAYSYASDTLFLGNAAGNGVINVGGLLYTQTIDNATSANTGSTLVKRDADGKFAGRLTGIADKADQLTNARNFSVSGHDITAAAVSFDGTGAVVLDASLNQVPGLTAGTYGSTTQIPSVTVGANGRVLAITTTDVATNLEVVGDSGNTTIDLLTETLRLTGGAGITSTVSSNEVTFDVDTTVVRANTPITIQTIDGAVQINGNLSVLGTQFITNTTSLNIADPLLYLASNNYSSDIVDIGFAGNYFDGSTQRHTGVFRNAGNKEFYIFDNYDKEPEANDIDVADASFRLATLNANLVSTLATINHAGITTATIDTLSLTNALTVDNGGTGRTSFTSGNMIIGAGTNALVQVANVTPVNVASAANTTVGTLVTDVYGRVTSFGTQAINGLTVEQGGTGQTSFTQGSIVIGNDAGGLLTLANTTYTQTGILTSNNTITSITVDAYGRFTAATTQAISGLTVPQGGTGASSFTTNGITYGNGSGAIQVTAAAGTSDQTWSNQVLTTTNAGVPVWTTALDGGTF